NSRAAPCSSTGNAPYLWTPALDMSRLPAATCRLPNCNMLAYILRRLLLMIPTILGVMAVSFAIVQFLPGGPVERMIAQLEGPIQSSAANFGGGGGQIGSG